jgi:5-hydroxyisourate hydrolase
MALTFKKIGKDLSLRSMIAICRETGQDGAKKERQMAGYLTTHVLDTARGCPAQGLKIALYRIEGGARALIAETMTNDDGRTDSPILPKDRFATGIYELMFSAGDYLRATGQAGDEPLFLDEVPIRFGMSDAAAHYHVPLLLSPFAYSTYRGS